LGNSGDEMNSKRVVRNIMIEPPKCRKLNKKLLILLFIFSRLSIRNKNKALC
jgi:hypothetical protein